MASTTTLLLSSLGSAVLGGLLGGTVVATMASDSSPQERGSRSARAEARSAGEEERDVLALEAKLAAMEGRLESLQRQQRSRQALEQYARQLSQSENGKAPDAEGNQPANSGTVQAEDPVFELAVRTVLDRVDWEREEEERLVRAQRRSERAERQTELLTERLGLTEEQTERVAAALTAQMDRFRALRDRDDASGGRGPATRTEWRQRAGEIREQTEKELSEVLDENQMQGYRAFVEDEGFGGPMGVGRRDRSLRGRPTPSAP